MASYDFTGNGVFGGSSNFLAALGGIGDSWGDGINSGIKMATNLANYNDLVNTMPSAQRAAIAKNIATQSAYEAQHYSQLPMVEAFSRLAGGAPLTDWQRQLLGNMGYVSGQGNNIANSLSGNVQGTPSQQNSAPSQTPAQPVQPSTPSQPNPYWTNPMTVQTPVGGWRAPILSGNTTSPYGGLSYGQPYRYQP